MASLSETKELPSLRASLTESPGPPGSPSVAVYNVGQISAYLRDLLDTDGILSDLWMAGEVGDLSRSRAGHLYFTLRDTAGALRCVFFRRENSGVPVEQGDQVLVHGRISLYLERGDVQIYVDALQPQGVGLLHAEFQRLLAQLEEEGLFDSARKRTLPPYPRGIGVATSPAGAVWHDIQNVLERRWPLANVVLAPCQVQGKGAAESIVSAIEALNAFSQTRKEADANLPLDLIVVARGGGSLEDLWPFNEEQLARAIFASELPIVSAVGHETDTTVADYVADLRAPTPSVAAELITPNISDERVRIADLHRALNTGLERRAGVAQTDLAALRDRLHFHRPDTMAERLRLDGLLQRSDAQLVQYLGIGRTALASLIGRLTTLDPAATLVRGYAILHDSNGRPLSNAAALKLSENIHIRLTDGTAKAKILDIELNG